jgi:hypothetical protein
VYQADPIGAALLGHTSLQTTRGYVAVFDDDVVRHYQQFLDNRRQLRPAEDYRPTTDEVDRVRGALRQTQGRTRRMRPPLRHSVLSRARLHPVPDAAGQPEDAARLDELETDLLDRRSRAEQEGWLGEIDGLDLT